MRIVAVVAALTLAPAAAFAHAELVDPVPRSACLNATNCKTAPCGTIPSGNPTKTFFVGSSYTISMIETIDHSTSRYRLALSTNGDAAFDTFVIMDYGIIADLPAPAPNDYAWTWVVPDITSCNPKCSLQLIQGMDDDDNGTFVDYFNCADIQILPAGAPTPEPTVEPTPTPTPSNPNDP